MLRRAVILTLLVACERAEPTVEPPTFAPDAPELEAIESTTTVHDPPPPAAAPIAPDLASLPRDSKRWFLALTADERHVVREICRIRKHNPCAGILRMKRPDGEPDPMDQLLAALPGDADDSVDMFCFHTNRGRGCATPLVVAFDNQPIEFARSAHTFAFTPGQPVASDWPTAATPWIALDRDGDGAITSGAELFRYDRLSVLDANRDGVIDRADPMFASLLLWADANGDHRSAPDELSPLSRVVTAIPLAHEVVPRCTAGNCEGERGTMTWTGGTGAVVDVYLSTTQ